MMLESSLAFSPPSTTPVDDVKEALDDGRVELTRPRFKDLSNDSKSSVLICLFTCACSVVIVPALVKIVVSY